MFLLRHLDTYILRYSLTRNPAALARNGVDRQYEDGGKSSPGKKSFL